VADRDRNSKQGEIIRTGNPPVGPDQPGTLDAEFDISGARPSPETVAGDPHVSWAFRVAALETVSRGKFVFEEPGISVSRERLAYEAGLLGLPLQIYPEVYRVDTRSPETIAREGFQPRSDKPAGTLGQHIETKTGNMVSGTALAGNDVIFYALANFGHLEAIGGDRVKAMNQKMASQFQDDLAELRRLLPEPLSAREYSFLNGRAFKPGELQQGVDEFLRLRKLLCGLPEAEKGSGEAGLKEFLEGVYNVHFALVERPSVRQSYRAFEYRLRDIEGVALNGAFKDFSFVEQQEVTFAQAAPAQIAAWREVRVDTHWTNYEASSGLWLKRDGVSLEFGAWKPFPA